MAVLAIAMGLLVMMSRDGAGGKTELSQHLMSAAAVAAAEDSGSSLGDSDSTQSLSSGGSKAHSCGSF